VEAIGLMRRVAPSTISRRLARAREALFDAVRKGLSKKLRLSDAEAVSLVRAVQSQLELSRLSRLL
jgi:hypothetical protein